VAGYFVAALKLRELVMRRIYLCSVAIISCLATAATAQTVTVIDPETSFPEGPLVIEGRLYFAQYGGNVATVVEGGTATDFWQQDGCGPSAVVPVNENFGITCYDSGAIVVIGHDGTAVARFEEDADGQPLTGPNDGVPDGSGGAYFTLSGPWTPGPVAGRIVHLSAAGVLTGVADDLNYPNGIVIGADGRLYVAESYAGTVTSFAIAADGTLSDRQSFAHLYQLGEDPGVFPDGLKIGPNGNFFVGLNSEPAILELAPDGSGVLARHTFASQGTPNMAFSEDGKTMFVMAVDNESGPPYEGRVLSVGLP
jgi:sugar lactone lactonase YvrE